jgi:hypothetical protein
MPSGLAADEFTNDSGSPSCAVHDRHPGASWAGRFEPAIIVAASTNLHAGSLAAVGFTHLGLSAGSAESLMEKLECLGLQSWTGATSEIH